MNTTRFNIKEHLLFQTPGSKIVRTAGRLSTSYIYYQMLTRFVLNTHKINSKFRILLIKQPEMLYGVIK